MRLPSRVHRPLRIAVLAAGTLVLAVGAASAADTYQVVPGDTLSALALRFETSVAKLEHLNRLTPDSPLLVGSTIELPPPPIPLVSYHVEPGDSLSAIASRFGTTPAAIAAASDITLASPITVGTSLKVPTPHPTTTAHRTSRIPLTRYRVKPGDTLSAIATRYGTTPAAIAAASNITLSNPITIGATLKVPTTRRQSARTPHPHPTPRIPLTRYRVQPGDTLSAIATRYGTTPAAIAAASNITLSNPITIGATLKVPTTRRQSARTPHPHPTPRIPLTRYRVQPGDTLSAIATRYGTTPAAIAAASNITLTNPITIGATLKVPTTRRQSARTPHPHPTPRIPLTRYRVQPGDTLSAIATRYGTTPAAIAAASNITLTNPITIGATLKVPTRHRDAVATRRAHPATAHPTPGIPLTTYHVRPGDTLSAIAARDGVSLGALADLNDLRLSAPLLVGTRLLVPGGTVAAAAHDVALGGVRGSIAFWASHYGVDPQLATALAWMESGFNNTLVSTAGAIGIMQITPQTWSYVDHVLLLGAPVPHTPDGNVRIGVAYLHHLLHLFGGDPHRALAAYYEGARAVQLEGMLPGTARYVADILALEQRF